MTKNYTSTRDNSVKISAKQAIKKGFSDDKGLFVYPNLGDTQVNLKKINYIKVPRNCASRPHKTITRLFIS